MKLEIDLGEEAGEAYERIIEELEEQSGEDIDPEKHATVILKQHIGQQYQSIILGEPDVTVDIEE